MQVLTLPGDIHIINDTYNANPGSMSAALETLMQVRQHGRGVAALGDMLELGDHSGPLHREVGRVAAREGLSHLLAMGAHASDLLEGAAESGMEDQWLTRASDHKDLALKLLPLLSAGDWVLVKGSRGMRMEKVVEELSQLLGNSAQDNLS
jgi:UDP-N-acetylmuramoyl-tripeptide--D-alanyl-D-alanine ligase